MKFEPGETVTRSGLTEPYAIDWDHPDGRLTLKGTGAANRDTVEPQFLVYRHPSLQFFKFSHLPAHLQEVSKNFHRLAHWMALTLTLNEQLTVSLQHLLEAKDAAVRARLFE